jgi:type I restriction enzyme S subunit
MSEEATLDEFVRAESKENSESEWNESKLEDSISELLTGNRPTGGGLEEGEYISIGGTQVNSEGYIDLHDLVYIPEEYFEQVKETQLQKHDILVVKDGANTGDVAIAWKSDDRIVTNEHLFTLRTDSSINSTYLFYFLLSHQGWKQINGTITGSAQEGINRGFTGKVDVQYPSLPEQCKIATILYTVDRAIQKTEKLVEQYRRVKRGVSQNILKYGIYEHNIEDTGSRFGELPSDWSLERLVDVAEIVGRTEPPTDVDKYWNGSIPWATPDDIRSLDGPTISETETTVTEVALEEVSSNLVPPGSVLLTTRATVGLCAINEIEMTTSRAFKDFIPGEKLDTWYLYYRMSTMEDYLNRLGWGSTFTEVIKPVLENVTIPVPSLAEQREIGEKLRSIDQCITENIRAKKQYQRVKKGLLQDLLTGTVCTTDTNIEVPEEIAQYG